MIWKSSVETELALKGKYSVFNSRDKSPNAVIERNLKIVGFQDKTRFCGTVSSKN